jgi:hypothetical protein
MESSKRLKELEAEILALKKSASWKVTRPLRALWGLPPNGFSKIVVFILLALIKKINRNPDLRDAVLKFLTFFHLINAVDILVRNFGIWKPQSFESRRGGRAYSNLIEVDSQTIALERKLRNKIENLN